MLSDWPSFDRLMQIAKEQPEELERLRVNEVNRVIADAPEYMRKRLRGLQFQIDCKRQLHKNPLGACISISEMMRDSLNRLNKALNQPLYDEDKTDSIKPRQVNNIIPFPCAG